MLIQATRDTKFRKICFNGDPRYRNTNVHKTHTVFVFFWFFNKKIFLYEKKNKQHRKKKNSKNMLSKTTKLDWLKRKTKHSSYAKQKQKEREGVIKSLAALFLPHLERTFPLSKPLNLYWGKRIETIQVRKEHEAFEKISKRSKRGSKLLLASKCYHPVALLSD